uniref:Reverse transcriptase zinc-binding domain-containing protein n=1 Tax=Cannabis sativa TaxID=3483 RepID=A0A803QQ25_CANSA
MYHRALLTNSQLIKRKLPIQPICHRCGEDTETPEHALVFCSSLRPLWSKLRIWNVLNRGRSGSLAELLVYLFEVLDQNNFSLLSMLWWWLWYDRNSVLFGKKQSRLEVIDVLAKEALEEFHGVGVSSGCRVLGASEASEARLGVRFGGVGQGRPRRGCVPTRGGRVCDVRGCGNHPGEGISWGSGCPEAEGGGGLPWAVGAIGDFQVAVAEVLTLRAGLLWATRLGFSLVRVETDSSVRLGMNGASTTKRPRMNGASTVRSGSILH